VLAQRRANRVTIFAMFFRDLARLGYGNAQVSAVTFAKIYGERFFNSRLLALSSVQASVAQSNDCPPFSRRGSFGIGDAKGGSHKRAR
jgi:hypothetical protein